MESVSDLIPILIRQLALCSIPRPHSSIKKPTSVPSVSFSLDFNHVFYAQSGIYLFLMFECFAYNHSLWAFAIFLIFFSTLKTTKLQPQQQQQT